MDNSGQRKRPQNELPMHPSSNPRYPLHDTSQHQRRSYADSQRDALRPAPSLGASSSSTSGGPRMGGSAGYGGYYQDTFSTPGISQGTMGYHQSATDYGQPDRQTQSFATSTYNPTMMYNVQPAAGTQSAGVYDTSQGFAPRQPAGLQMMTADVTAPYFASEHSAAAASSMQPQAASSGSSHAVYQQPSLQSYSTSTMAPTGGGAMASQTSAPAEAGAMEEGYNAATGGLDEAYASYKSALSGIFQNIRDGALPTASESLLEVSNWLLSHVAELGLTTDDRALFDDRLKLFREFNNAWLGLFQRQKNMMLSSAPLQRGLALLSKDELEKMGKELLRLCDMIEPYGLVDYQYGVSEEDIVEILIECMDLYEPSGGQAVRNLAGSSSRRR